MESYVWVAALVGGATESYDNGIRLTAHNSEAEAWADLRYWIEVVQGDETDANLSAKDAVEDYFSKYPIATPTVDRCELDPPNILVAVKGGIVTNVTCDRPALVTAIDYDVANNVSGSPTVEVPQSGGKFAEAYRDTWKADVDPEHIAMVKELPYAA